MNKQFKNIAFENYVTKRIEFYNILHEFTIDESMISNKVLINNELINTISENFNYDIVKRIRNEKFTKAENISFKTNFQSLFPETKEIFDHKAPAIYSFKILNCTSEIRKSIITNYIETKKSGTGWWSKADPMRAMIDSDILYIGKIQGALQNRFLQHLGLGHDYTTALKLQRWMNKIPLLELEFSFIKIDDRWKKHLTDIENVIWKHNNPIIGQQTSVTG